MPNNPYNDVLDILLAGESAAIDALSAEEPATIEALCQVATKLKGVPIYLWDSTYGLRHVCWSADKGVELKPSEAFEESRNNPNPPPKPPGGTLKDQGWEEGGDLGVALKFAREAPMRFPGAAEVGGLFVFADLHKYLATTIGIQVSRSIKSTIAALKTTGKTRLITIGQNVDLPEDLEGYLVPVSIPLPDEAARREEIGLWIMALRESDPRVTVPNAADPVWSEMVMASATLSRQNIGSIIRRVATRKKVVGAPTVEAFQSEKVKNLLKIGIKIVEPPTIELGGFSNFREWLESRADYFNLGNPFVSSPKGCVLVGIPGTGKSLAGMIAGRVLGVPVLSITADLLLGGLVGESEKKTRLLLERLEAAAPAVVLLDEMDKMLGGMASESGDSGVGSRVFGMILSFLQNNRSPLFWIATANRTAHLPPELFRPGRFDRVFWVDLPNRRDRYEILANHMKRWGVGTSAQKIDEMAGIIADYTDGYIGAELAQLVAEAANDAYSGGHPGELKIEHLRNQRNQANPQSETRREEFAELRRQSANFYPASAPEAVRGGDLGVSVGRNFPD